MINTTTTTNSVKELIVKANQWRRAIIQTLFNSAVVKNISGTTVAPSAEILNLDELSADFIAVGTNPVDKSFSNHDLIHFGNELADERDVNSAKLAEVQQVINISRGQRVNPLFLKDHTHFTSVIAKCNVVLSFLGEELDRREAEEKNAKAAIAATAAAQREHDRLEHEAFLEAMRTKYSRMNKKHIPDHTPHADKLIGKGLESLSVIKADMDKAAADAALQATIDLRKACKFISERVMKKAEVIELIGKENFTKLPYTMADYRLVVAVKSGAVTRYVVKE